MNTPTNLAGTVAMILLAGLTLLVGVGFYLLGLFFWEAFIPAGVCGALLLLFSYRIYQADKAS